MSNSGIIKPGHGPILKPTDNIQALAQINKRLMREIDDRYRTIRQQAANIQAMNKVFTDIATTLGTPVPTTPQEGIEALKKMLERIEGLIETEKIHTECHKSVS